MVETRFKTLSKILEVVITAAGGVISVISVIHNLTEFGVSEMWLEPLLDVFYIACLLLIWLYFFNRIESKTFNYWCTVLVGITVMLRDVIFAMPMANPWLGRACLTLNVVLLCMLTYFYSRKDWKSYTKMNLWMICIIDSLIATLLSIDLVFYEQETIYFDFVLTEIWIRPTITYGLVACFISEKEEEPYPTMQDV